MTVICFTVLLARFLFMLPPRFTGVGYLDVSVKLSIVLEDVPVATRISTDLCTVGHLHVLSML